MSHTSRQIREHSRLVRSAVSSVEWHTVHVQGDAVSDTPTERALAPNGAAYDARFVMATEGVASDGGILRMSGVDLSRFLTNPVALLFHDYASFPVGRWVHVEVEGSALVGYLRFHAHTQDARVAAALVEEGYLRTVSIGFQIRSIRTAWGAGSAGLTKAEATAGAEWVGDEWELLECSLVPVPADAGALAAPRTAEADEPTNEEATEDVGGDSAQAEPDAACVDTCEQTPACECPEPQADTAALARLMDRLTALRLAAKAAAMRQ
jgi:HK97 family phage prohead protease